MPVHPHLVVVHPSPTAQPAPLPPCPPPMYYPPKDPAQHFGPNFPRAPRRTNGASSTLSIARPRFFHPPPQEPPLPPQVCCCLCSRARPTHAVRSWIRLFQGAICPFFFLLTIGLFAIGLSAHDKWTSDGAPSSKCVFQDRERCKECTLPNWGRRKRDVSLLEAGFWVPGSLQQCVVGDRIPGSYRKNDVRTGRNETESVGAGTGKTELEEVLRCHSAGVLDVERVVSVPLPSPTKAAAPSSTDRDTAAPFDSRYVNRTVPQYLCPYHVAPSRLEAGVSSSILSEDATWHGSAGNGVVIWEADLVNFRRADARFFRPQQPLALVAEPRLENTPNITVGHWIRPLEFVLFEETVMRLPVSFPYVVGMGK